MGKDSLSSFHFGSYVTVQLEYLPRQSLWAARQCCHCSNHSSLEIAFREPKFFTVREFHSLLVYSYALLFTYKWHH